MLASFIIGFHTRRFDNLLQTLRFLLQDHETVFCDSEIVTICQDEVSEANLDKVRLDTFKGSPAAAVEQFGKLAGRSKSWKHFNLNVSCMQLPTLTNFGVRSASCEKLVILESDRLLPAGYFESVLNDLREGVQITTRNMKKLTAPAEDEAIRHGTFPFVDEDRSTRAQIGLRNMWSGNTALLRSDFEKAGGMDEAYKGYGWADNDMTMAMEKAGVESVFRDEMELHLWHESATYGSGDQKKLFLDNGRRFLSKWSIEPPEWFTEEEKVHRRQNIRML